MFKIHSILIVSVSAVGNTIGEVKRVLTKGEGSDQNMWSPSADEKRDGKPETSTNYSVPQEDDKMRITEILDLRNFGLASKTVERQPVQVRHISSRKYKDSDSSDDDAASEAGSSPQMSSPGGSLFKKDDSVRSSVRTNTSSTASADGAVTVAPEGESPVDNHTIKPNHANTNSNVGLGSKELTSSRPREQESRSQSSHSREMSGNWSHEQVIKSQHLNARETTVGRPHDHENRPHEYENRPHEYENRPHDYENRPHDYESRPHDYENRPHDYENRPHTSRPRGMSDRPHEQEIRSHMPRPHDAGSNWTREQEMRPQQRPHPREMAGKWSHEHENMAHSRPPPGNWSRERECRPQTANTKCSPKFEKVTNVHRYHHQGARRPYEPKLTPDRSPTEDLPIDDIVPEQQLQQPDRDREFFMVCFAEDGQVFIGRGNFEIVFISV